MTSLASSRRRGSRNSGGVIFLRHAVAILFLASCRPEPAIHTVERTQILMDTLVLIKVFLPDSTQQPQALAAIDAAFAEMARIDTMMSSYRGDNEVAAINRAGARAASSAAISAEMDSVLRAALEISERSAGAFDITIAPVMKLWGFGTDSLHVPAAEKIQAQLAAVGFHHLKLEHAENEGAPSTRVRFTKDDAAIDLGGIAKGYAIDRGWQTLAQHGFHDVLVEAGGDLRVKSSALTSGRRHVWVRHPRTTDEFFARFNVDGGAVATSGDYERFFEHNSRRYHHILDPKTGYPAWNDSAGTQMLGVTVVAPTAMIADAFATAVFVLGPEHGISLAEKVERLEALVIFKQNGKLRWRATENFKKKLEVLANN